MTEEELAIKVISYLESNDWEIFQEVAPYGYRSRTCDIVARKNNQYWAIEVKQSLGLAVIEQAHYWLHNAHFVSVAVSVGGNSRTRCFAEYILRHLGMGCIEVGKNTDYVSETVPPKLTEISSSQFDQVVCEEHKTFAKAGNAKSKRFTPFQKTKMLLLEYVKQNNNSNLLDVLKNIDHHYSSIYSGKKALENLIIRNVIDLKYRCENNKFIVFIEE